MIEPTITHHAETFCPVCNYKLNASSNFTSKHKPKRDDLSVCMNCAAILTYEDDALHLRAMTLDEIGMLEPGQLQELREMQSAVWRFNARDSPF